MAETLGELIVRLNSPSKVMAELGGYAVAGLQQGMLAKQPDVETASQTIADSVVARLSRVQSRDIGLAYGAGVAQGIRDSTSTVAAAARAMAEAANRTYAQTLAIHSPSRVMRERGRQTGEGVALGLEDATSRVQNAMSHISSLLANSANSASIFAPQSTPQYQNTPAQTAVAQQQPPITIYTTVALDRAMIADEAMVNKLSEQVGIQIRRQFEQAQRTRTVAVY